MVATRAPIFIILGAALAVGCASSGSGTAEDGSAAPARSSSNVILREEIIATGPGNMEEVIQRLRPQFLRGRGRTSINLPADQIAVYMDDVHLGTVSVLNTIGANAVLRVEFIRGADTGFRFGLDHQAGVIHIITK